MKTARAGSGVEDAQIQTVLFRISKTLTSVARGGTAAGGGTGIGAVPSGMKRWVTFLKLTNNEANANALLLGSGATATDIVSGTNLKDHQYLGNQYDAFAYPDTPSIERPLFSIAGGKYLTARTTTGSMAVFIQYFDL